MSRICTPNLLNEAVLQTLCIKHLCLSSLFPTVGPLVRAVLIGLIGAAEERESADMLRRHLCKELQRRKEHLCALFTI